MYVYLSEKHIHTTPALSHGDNIWKYTFWRNEISYGQAQASYLDNAVVRTPEQQDKVMIPRL